MRGATLTETMAVLSFDPRSGEPLLLPTILGTVVTGAMLIDLCQSERITVSATGIVTVPDSSPTDSSPTGQSPTEPAFLDTTLRAIAATSPTPASEWISTLAVDSAELAVSIRDAAVAEGRLDLRRRRRLVTTRSAWFPHPGSDTDRAAVAISDTAVTRGAPITAATGGVIALMDSARILRYRFPGADESQIATARRAQWAPASLRPGVGAVLDAVRQRLNTLLTVTVFTS